MISNGEVKISRPDPNSEQEFIFANLQQGDLFGEFSLIDEEPRSANAIAIKNTELIVLNKEDFWKQIYQDPLKVNALLKIFCKRIRGLNESAFIYARGSTTQRLHYFFEQIK